MKALRGVEVKLVTILSALDGVGGQRHAPAVLPPGKTRYPLYRGLGGSQGHSGRAENLVPTGIRSPDRPARSELLYRLSYPGPQGSLCGVKMNYFSVETSDRTRKKKHMAPVSETWL